MSEGSGVISLYDPLNGVGALQISLAQRTRQSPVDPSEALDLAVEFAKQKGWLDVSAATQFICDGSPASYFVFVEEGDEPTFWRVWHLLDRTRVALLTYNCALGSEDVELSACEEVVESFRWQHTA